MATAAEYDAQIRAAVTSHELNVMAEKCAKDRTISDHDRALLQLRFDLRCRDIAPHAYRGRGRGRRS